MGNAEHEPFFRRKRVLVGVAGLALLMAVVCGSLALMEPAARSGSESGATPGIVPSILVLA